jgi:hypothetical protein
MIKTRTKFQETTASAASYESAGKITITVIKPGMSKNKRFYPASVLRNSVAVFKNAKMFTEHSNQNGVKEWVGCLAVAWAESDGTIKGAGQIIDPLFKKKLELLAGAGKLSEMGVSISCIGTAIDGEENGTACKVVESLDECQSVDFVARPAAGGKVDAIESEGDNQQVAGCAHSLTVRGFTAPGLQLPMGSGVWKRGKVAVTVNADGSWTCGKSHGKDCHELDSLLDGQYPKESVQDRLKAAFEKILPPAEAALAARGPTPNGSEIDVQLRGKALLDQMDLLELE